MVRPYLNYIDSISSYLFNWIFWFLCPRYNYPKKSTHPLLLPITHIRISRSTGLKWVLELVDFGITITITDARQRTIRCTSIPLKTGWPFQVFRCQRRSQTTRITARYSSISSATPNTLDLILW